MCTPVSSETNIWKQRILQAAMPQLIPFYFVNEVTTAFIIMPTLIYIFSKYLLPQRVRMMCARLFISKL
jgi:F-type H+-transporting ATPase subunit 8